MYTTNSGGSWAQSILDEIALEGLEGVTLPDLWVLLSKRLGQPLPFPAAFQQQIWTFLLRCGDKLQFYELPKEREQIKTYNRYEHLDDQLGIPIAPTENLYTRYTFAPIQDGQIFGSCEDYKTRKELHIKQLEDMTIEAVMKSYGQKLVLVASQDMRYMALTPRNSTRPKELTAVQYTIWECIGRSRYNGETTSGPCSLFNVCKDSSILFYIKNKLLRLNLIAQQYINEKRDDRCISSNLLSLTRFFRAYKSHLDIVVEKLYLALKDHPEGRMTTMEVREILPFVDKLKSLKKIMMTPIFQKIFETNNVPYAEIHKKSKGKDRKITVIKLRHADLSLEELYRDVNDQDKQEKHVIEFFSNKHAFIDMPLEEQCYRAVLKHGKTGISLPELTQYMGMNHLTVRTLMKYLDREKLVTVYQETQGRQRVLRYVAKKVQESMKNEKDDKTAIKILKCADEPNIPTNSNITLNDVPSITAVIKRGIMRTYKKSHRETSTKRQLDRKEIIVKLVDEKCLVKINDIRKAIKQHETAQGFKEAVCCKSIFRILDNLCDNHIVNSYEITLKYGDELRLYRYVTHPKIDPEHSLLQREILRLKNYIYLVTEERKTRPSHTKRLLNRPKTVPLPRKISSVGDFKPKSPKLLLARAFHEFLFYVGMELDRDQLPQEINEQLLQNWQRIEPALPLRAYLAEYEMEETRANPYSEHLSWRTFIPPLPRYEGKPAGWVYLMDVIERVPLSVFNKLFRIERCTDAIIQAYLKHPIRQHYLISSLKLQTICTRLELQRLYMTVLRLLNNMGLVQVTERMLRDPLQLWVYINKKARILDTTPSEPGYDKINSTREYNTMKFEFSSHEDVTQYWSQLQRICIYTKLGFRRKREVPTGVRTRFKTIDFVRTIQFDEAIKYDNGIAPGDQLGAAGLSSFLYAHQFRHWSWMVQTKPTKGVASSKIRLASVSDVTRRKHTKQLLLSRGKSRASAAPIRLINTKGAGTLRARQMKKLKKSAPRDDIDRDALKNMRTLRVAWSKEEDKILKMARTVYLFISAPLSTLTLLDVGRVCRDIIRGHIGICNKTQQACVRRLQFLMRMKRDVPDVHTWLYTLQSNQELTRTYNDDFLEHLKLDYPVRTDYTDALIVHFVLVMNTLNKIIHNTNSNSRHGNFMIPDNVTDYTQQLRECVPRNGEHVLHHVNPNNEHDLQVTIAQCVLHSTLCCARDKTLYNLQAFEIYKHFTEEVLNCAFKKSRAESLLIAQKRRNIESFNRVSGPAFFFSSKYKYRLLYLKIPYMVYDRYYAYEQLAWRTFFVATATASCNERPTLELKSPNFAQLLYIGEGLVHNYIDLDIKLPANILTVDTSEHQTQSATDRILDHFQSILDNAPQTEYLKQIDMDNASRQVRVKFQPANLSYKVFYSPYDYISKLPQRSLHFFCALDNLHKPVDINFGKLQRKDTECGAVLLECPFHCILSSGYYINAIERIVSEKKTIIKELSVEMAPQKLLNQASSGNAVIVQPNNLLTLVRMLETFWREKDESNERKDLGKMAANIKQNKNIDWQGLCMQLIEYDPDELEQEQLNNEYEPTLNKEERVRAQDVFVVSLPLLQLQPSSKITTTENLECERLQRDGVDLMVPKVLSDSEYRQKSILEKTMDEANWKYTENTFDTLRPILLAQNYSEREQLHIQEILDFIGDNELGVTAVELKREFPLGKFLLNALKILASHWLIKRVGVSTFMYVHKNHIRNWVVHTFHIKRLDRERVNTAQLTKTTVAQKRKAETAMTTAARTTDVSTNDDDDDDGVEVQYDEAVAVAAKKPKLNESAVVEASSCSKRTRRRKKPVQRYGEFENDNTETVSTAESTADTIISEVARDVIVMRPQPWMRVNGSLNRRVLDRWLSGVLSECITRTGCTVHALFLRYPHMVQVDIMFLLELLCDLECIHLMEMQVLEKHLDTCFEDDFKEERVTELYDPVQTYVVAHSDAVGRLSNFIGLKKYSAEFI